LEWELRERHDEKIAFSEVAFQEFSERASAKMPQSAPPPAPRIRVYDGDDRFIFVAQQFDEGSGRIEWHGSGFNCRSIGAVPNNPLANASILERER